ncbi:pentatricopeptide repeat-containing protein At4g16835, mitochondrial [Rosa rugosa]|uniref:pentatricopeptide repeat-containing protein At4g16835, mitochondrial n=1 Tax=Rosa rugosa TaxID=74645 RepID=UPI002B406802|nr:pentatricopeptide repeat-containing protein At4g16835, mitochondrial [Rosa rugosa]
MRCLRRSTRAQPSLLLKTFPNAKNQSSSLSTITIQNPQPNQNNHPIPPHKTHLVSTSNMTQKLTPTQFCNESTHFDPHQFRNVIASNKLITSYIRSGDLDSALKVFEKMTVRTTTSWNSILAGYAKIPGKVKEARQLFDKIPQPDTCSYNSMLACYLRNLGVGSAMEFFDLMPVKDIASWNTMISGFAQNGEMREAQKLFLLMPEKNSVSWSALVSGYVKCGDLDSAVKWFEVAPVKSVVAWTAMVTGYMKFGKIGVAEKLFREMPEKNLVTWNAMVAGYVENCRAEEGLKLFRSMIGYGVGPNASSLSSALLGCSNLSALQMGRQVHQLLYKFELYNDTTSGTALVSMYCKCGNLEDAWKFFIEMTLKDVVTWNAMIAGYAQHGEGLKALSLFDQMRNEGVKPDWITFVSVLMACNHAGLVDLGVQYFDSMARQYQVEAKPEHYTCMVDLLGRAGKLVEAVALIKKMPFEPHSAIFGTLLGACRMHKNLELAEFAAEKLLDLDPTSAAGYVQLANVYAATNRWDLVGKVRRSMKENRVVKTPGYSWIEVKSVVHEFRSGDRAHPELASIHEKLSELDQKMKLAGYVPDLEFALHDVGEEQKQQLLLWHSEKLAIAFGLIHVPLGMPIRIFKNLRVCGDCHHAVKYISAIEKREIILRDTTRFHHFKNGVCSCGDYW